MYKYHNNIYKSRGEMMVKMAVEGNDDKEIESEYAPVLTELKSLDPFWAADVSENKCTESLDMATTSTFHEDFHSEEHYTNTGAVNIVEDDDIRDPTYIPNNDDDSSHSSSGGEDNEQCFEKPEDHGSTNSDKTGKDQIITNILPPLNNPYCSSLPMSLVPYSDTDSDLEQEVISETIQDKVRSKKRVRNEKLWKKNVRKRRRLSGKSYVGIKGEFQKEKALGAPCKDTCRLQCNKKIPIELRRDINSEFWSEERSWECKRQFVAMCIKTRPISRSRPKDGSRKDKRMKTHSYSFNINGKDVPVCKTFFLKTLSISETFVQNSLNKSNEVAMVYTELRGHHTPANKTPSDVIEQIKQHISKYPTYESHYTRENTSKKYLGNHLNIKTMYKLYCNECEISAKAPAKEWLFYKVFNEEFNLSFREPAVDTCDTCDLLSRQLKDTKTEDERTQIRNCQKEHHDDADRRYNIKKADKLLAKEDEKHILIMADLQKCLPTPNLTNAQSFYLRKLWTLNYTIHNPVSQDTWCMIWEETTGGRGGNEMASCLFSCATQCHMYNDEEAESLTIWTDNCAGQNRNIMMVLMYMWLLHRSTSLQEINHKFLLRGHTHMEVDGVHSIIERARHKISEEQPIYTCNDWVNLIRKCRTKPPIKTYRMELKDFINFSSLTSGSGPFIARKKDNNGENFQISSAVWLQVRKSELGTLYYKNTFEENFKSIDLRRCRRKIIEFPEHQPILRKQKKRISSAKYRDLMQLLPWIAEEYRPFFTELPHGDNEPDYPESE